MEHWFKCTRGRKASVGKAAMIAAEEPQANGSLA